MLLAKQNAAAATPTRKTITLPVDETRIVNQNAENALGVQLSLCRVCLDTEARMYHMSEHGLSTMYAQVVGVQINTEDRLPQHLCGECVGELSSANCFILKALKSQWILTNKITKSRNTRKTTDNEEDVEVSDTVEVNISNAEQTINIKQESTSYEEVPVNDASVSKILQEGTQVDKLNEVSEFIKQSDKGNNILSPLRNWRSKTPTGCKELAEDIVLTKCNTENSSKQATVNAEQSTSNLAKKLLIEIPIKEEIMIKDDVVTDFSSDCADNVELPQSSMSGMGEPAMSARVKPSGTASQVEVIFKDDCDMFTEYSADCTETVKLPQSVIKEESTSHNINTNTSMAQKKNMNFFIAAEYPKRLFICDICDKSFHHKRSLILHIKKHSKMHYCIYCSYTTYLQETLKKHVYANHTRSTLLKCPHCSYKTFNKSHLLVHVNGKHTKSEVFICSQCSYKAYTKSTLARHINAKHTKSIYFNCTQCSYKAYQKWILTKHVKTKHTRNQVFNCPHCIYTTYQNCDLSKHINTKHTKSEVYNCPHCSYKAYAKSTLTKHINSKHTQNMFLNCTHCSYKAYQKWDLTNHVNVKHIKGEVLNCPHCSYEAFAKSTLKRHISAKHQ